MEPSASKSKNGLEILQRPGTLMLWLTRLPSSYATETLPVVGSKLLLALFLSLRKDVWLQLGLGVLLCCQIVWAVSCCPA